MGNHRRIRKPERPQHSSRVSKGSALSLPAGEVTVRFRRFAQPMTGNPWPDRDPLKLDVDLPRQGSTRVEAQLGQIQKSFPGPVPYQESLPEPDFGIPNGAETFRFL